MSVAELASQELVLDELISPLGSRMQAQQQHNIVASLPQDSAEIDKNIAARQSGGQKFISMHCKIGDSHPFLIRHWCEACGDAPNHEEAVSNSSMRTPANDACPRL